MEMDNIIASMTPCQKQAVASLIDLYNDCNSELRARIAELEAERAELVKDRERLAEVHAYLLGEAPIAGRWFGDDLPPKTPKFWWRKHLRQAIDATREVADD